MFGTILGSLPTPPLPGVDQPAVDDLIRIAIDAQTEAGLEPVSDGRLRWQGWLGPLADRGGPRTNSTDSLFVDGWFSTAAMTDRAVKQAMPGPYSAGRRLAPGSEGREKLTLGLAETLNAEIARLVAAGCPLIEVDEPDAIEVGTDESERRLFVEAHRRLTSGLSAGHLSLALSGGNADTAGPGTFIDAPYASYAIDLINGPDNWRLVTAIPGDRGIICGALDARADSEDSVELLVWATRYAASTGGRGLERVGLAVVPGLDREDWRIVEKKLGILGRAVAMASLEGNALAAAMDPRAVDSRSAALGRYEPVHDRPRRRR